MDPRPRRILIALALVGIGALCILRFTSLDADPPRGLTYSGVLYTDEGWYSRNAVSRYLGGPWIVEGDFNPIVNMPVMQVVNYAAFELLGMGLRSARLPGALASVLTLLVLFLSLRRRMEIEVVVTALLLLAANFLLFAFSRVAIAENLLLLFIVCSFYFGMRGSSSGSLVDAGLSAFFLALAVLTKLVAVFFLPVMIFLFLGVGEGRSPGTKSFAKMAGLALGVLAVVLGCYFLAVVLPRMEDFRYFNALNISRRIKPFVDETAFVKAIYVVKGSSLRHVGLSLIAYVGGMMSILIVLFSVRLKRDPVLVAMVLWVLFYIGLVALNGYAPPRYYIPVLVPLTVIMVKVAFWLPGSIEGRILPPALGAIGVTLIGASLVTNVGRVISYIEKPEYSFKTMAKEVRALMTGSDSSESLVGGDRRGNPVQGTPAGRLGEGSDAAPSLIGHFANSISLEAGVVSYNDTYRSWPLSELMTKYRPSYYVCYGPVEKINPLDEYYESAKFMAVNFDLVFVARFDVLGNYYRGVPVYLYRIEPKKLEPHKSAGMGIRYPSG